MQVILPLKIPRLLFLNRKMNEDAEPYGHNDFSPGPFAGFPPLFCLFVCCFFFFRRPGVPRGGKGGNGRRRRRRTWPLLLVEGQGVRV